MTSPQKQEPYPCDWCSKKISYKARHEKTKRHFCNVKCRRKYESTYGSINTNIKKSPELRRIEELAKRRQEKNEKKT